MSNRRIDARLREADVFYFELLKALGRCVVFMSLFRFILWWAAPIFFAEASALEIAAVFMTGVRFDLLVMGFLLLPVVLVVSGTAASGFGERWGRRAAIVFLASAWAVISGLAFIDLFFFVLHGRRWSVFDFESSGFAFWSDARMSAGATSFLLVAGIFVCCWLLGNRGLVELWRLESAPSSEMEESPLHRAWRLLRPLLLAGLLARGTLTPHHLEREHSEVSAHRSVNELALNAIWSFDKEPKSP